MYAGTPSDHGRQSIRPSLADLTSDDFFEKLQVEANQLRNGQILESNHNTTNPMPTLASNRAKVEAPRSSTAKKSRFAQQREAELQSSQSLDGDSPVPTGRFELDLGAEGNDDRDPSQAATTNTKGPPPVMAEIMERCSNPPNNHSDPTFRADAMPGTISSTSLNPQTSIPPWELRRLASRHSSQKSQQTPTDKPSIPIAQNKSCCDVTPTGGSAKGTIMATEKCQISSENEALLSQMSPDEILREQAAIKAQLMQSNPELLTKLLTKFNMDSPAHQGPSDTSTLPIPISKKQKHVRYAEDDIIPLDPPPFQKEIGSCTPKPHLDGLNDPRRPSPLKFDWNGIRVADLEDPHQTDRSSDENIHVHHTSAYTFKQLLRLIISSVPSQRIMGFKIVTQIVVRYLNSSNHGLDDAEMAILTEELNGASLEILTIAAQATRERNLGIATSAITLLASILSQASTSRTSQSSYECIVKSDWIEELITQTTLLADFHSQLQHQELPRQSLTSIVQILRDLITLGDSAKVSEEIVKRPSFLELIIQVLVVVPWPLSSTSRLEVPDLSAFELLLELAKSSRSCSRSILDRALLTPMLRFVALPYWSLVGSSDSVAEGLIPVPNDHIMGVLIHSMRYQFELISVFGGYGLGANLRTTLDPLLRTTSKGLYNILQDAISDPSSAPTYRVAQEFTLISAFIKLLQSWIQCADDPHFCDPPHSITWSQVTEWESSTIDFLRLSSISGPRSPGLNEVLACVCDSLASYIGRSSRKKTNIGSCLASLESLMPQLETIFKTTTNNVIPYSHEDCKSQPDLFSQFRLLISFAKLKTCLSRSNSTSSKASPLLAATYFQYNFPDEFFASSCRLAFEVEGLSLLPWALSVCHISSDTTSNLERFLLAGLLVRNSDGMVVGDLLAETLNRCQSRVNAQFQNASKHSTQLIELSRLSPIFNDYIDQSSPSTRISDPSPHQLQNQTSQNEKSAFLLSSTWPLLVIAFLRSEHLASASTTSQIGSSDVVRASLAMTLVVQSLLCDMQGRFESLSDIFQTLILDRCSVWKTVMTAIIATTSQTYRLNHQDTEEPLESIFEDEACADLIIRLMDTPNRLAPPRSQTNGFKPNSQPEAIKVQESEDVELYTIFTDILATFDSTSFGNRSFVRILVPFLSMRRGREFRGKLFSDHGDILKHMKIGTEDVISLNDSGLKEYLYPLEDSAQMLHLFAETLTNPSTSINSREYPFLFLYLIHHLSSQIYNSILEDRIRIDLLKVILNKAKDDEICQAILYYDQPINSSHDIPGLADSLVSQTVIPNEQSDGQDDRGKNSKLRKLQSLQELFSSTLAVDHHQSSVNRLTRLGWEISST
ncbi:hypothetical protein Pst134EB_006444 [Puccinia striiformis f. sp. tritici]|nr:hypothetical protein Pst134EB_006444 [Puccinia striiformis f. sp. tritici]